MEPNDIMRIPAGLSLNDKAFLGLLAASVPPGGTIAFHDRAMLGVRLLCDALEAVGTLRGFCGVHNFVAATVEMGARYPETDDYIAALGRHLRVARHTSPKADAQDFWPFRTYWGDFDDLSDTQLVGKGCMGWFVKNLFGLAGDLFIDSDQVRRPQNRHILLSDAFRDIAYALQVKAFVPPDRIAVYPQFRMAEAFMEQVLDQGEGVMRLAADDPEREMVRRTFGTLSRSEFQALTESTFVAKFIREFWYFRWFSDFAETPANAIGI